MKTKGVSIGDCSDKLVTLLFLFIISMLFLLSVASGDMPPGPPDLNISGRISYSDDVPAVNANITITSMETKKSYSVLSGEDGSWVFYLSTTEYPNGTEALITAIDSVGNTAKIIVNVSVEAQPQIVNMKFKVPAPTPPPTLTPTDSGDGDDDSNDGYVPATPKLIATPAVTPVSTPTAALTQTPEPTPASTITVTETPTAAPKKFNKLELDALFVIAPISAAAILLAAVYLRRRKKGEGK